ncbi:hypothetical protein F5888DRAFT_1807321 [Russula emetica]|nr:hypothetical protein F5888DRAFT_1807321 [Russula emetica]
MRRYKLAVHILVILSVFNFVPVLAFPVPVQEVREACADVADGSEDVIIVSGKRAEEGEDSSSGYHGLTQASPGPGSMSVQSLTSSQDPAGSPSTSNYASGVHQETTNPIQLPSYASGGTELPWYSSGGMRRPSYASGGTELSWYSSDDTGRGGVQPVQPEITSKIPSISSVRTKTSKNRWMAASSMRTKTDKWVSTTETEPVSSSSGKITPASSSEVLPPSEQERYLAQTPTEQPRPQFESFLSDLASKPKFRPRISRSSATGSSAVNAARRELQGTVQTEAVTL